MASYSTPSKVIYPVANRRFKDSVFRDLFGSQENKAYALSLYNALAGTTHEDPDELELNTIDDVIFMGVRNDVSFVIGDELVLWEHQSTPNANMPLRGLLYFARLYSALVENLGSDAVYASKRIALPTPRFYVFYNGTADVSDRQVMRLSDAYSGKGDVEVVATILNINEGRNPELATACAALAGYSHFVSRVRELCETMAVEMALERAIDECIEQGFLVDYLLRRRVEVREMYLTEWDEEAYREVMRREAREDGFEEGRKSMLLDLVRDGVLSASDAAERLGVCEELIVSQASGAE